MENSFLSATPDQPLEVPGRLLIGGTTFNQRPAFRQSADRFAGYAFVLRAHRCPADD